MPPFKTFLLNVIIPLIGDNDEIDASTCQNCIEFAYCIGKIRANLKSERVHTRTHKIMLDKNLLNKSKTLAEK